MCAAAEGNGGGGDYHRRLLPAADPDARLLLLRPGPSPTQADPRDERVTPPPDMPPPPNDRRCADFFLGFSKDYFENDPPK